MVVVNGRNRGPISDCHRKLVFLGQEKEKAKETAADDEMRGFSAFDYSTHSRYHLKGLSIPGNGESGEWHHFWCNRRINHVLLVIYQVLPKISYMLLVLSINNNERDCFDTINRLYFHGRGAKNPLTQSKFGLTYFYYGLW